MAKKRKTGLQAVAALAGVGIATVDRVLNERGNTSLETTRKVLDAARQLRINRILPTPYRKLKRIEVLLARADLPFIARMNREFQRLAATVDRSVVIQRTTLPDDAAETIARAIRRTRCDGVIVYALENPLVHAAIAEIRARNVPTVTMISDLPRSGRLAYAGIDHYSAGRTAGYFLGRMVSRVGPVLILCHQLSILGHAERIRGCRDHLQERGSPLGITEVIEGHDDHALSETLLLRALRRHRGVAAIYNVGAPNRAVGAAILAVAAQAKPVFIGHELTPDTRQLLRNGLMALTIDQNPEQQARTAIDILLQHFGAGDTGWAREDYAPPTPFTLYGPENIPA